MIEQGEEEMNYRVKPEFRDILYMDSPDLLTEAETKRVFPYNTHPEQLEPVKGNIAEISRPLTWGKRYLVKTRSAMKAAHEYGSGMRGEQVTILDTKGREISKVICGMRGYYRVNVKREEEA